MHFYSHIVFVVLFTLFNLCASHVIRDNETFLWPPKYTHYDNLIILFLKLQSTYPELAKVSSIGKSVEGRELLIIQITENVAQKHLGRPSFKYVANMHGDESVGRQLLIYLAQYLLLNYGKSDRVTKLVNNIDIYLIPSLNPDGYEASQEGNCNSFNDFRGRNNAKGIDLNRDFPDQFDNNRSNKDSYLYDGRQPETRAMIRWVINKQFVLSANLHGGAVVASYPFDDDYSGIYCCKESRTPDDNLFKRLAHSYADLHPLMQRGYSCQESFKDGITNGAFWYGVKGTMQDFNYLNSNCLELTLELSCCKYPVASKMINHWRYNKDSLLSFMEQIHTGVKGFVFDEKGTPVEKAEIVVDSIDHSVKTTESGEYWRLLPPGKFNLTATSVAFIPHEPIEVIVLENQSEAIVLNFTLKRRNILDVDSS